MRTTATRILALLLMGLSMSLTIDVDAEAQEHPDVRPLVIGHRGASGYVPEHTLTSYFIAVQQGADFIEPDLVSTKDGVLIARHENEISGTTNVAMHPEFASRKTTKSIDGLPIEGWFTEDFTLAEIKTLRARERLPQLRASNTRFDNQFEIPTFDEILSLVRALERMRGPDAPRIGIYPETKHPTYFRKLGLPLEGTLLRTLKRWGYRGKDAPIFLQSFEVGNLKELRKKTDLPIVQLIEAKGAPFDFTVAHDPRQYADMLNAEGLHQIAQYANVIGVDKSLLIPLDARGAHGSPTHLVNAAHAAGLKVHAWTLRAENNFLPTDYRVGVAPESLGRLNEEIAALLGLGIDGFFTDQPALGVLARNAWLTEQRK